MELATLPLSTTMVSVFFFFFGHGRERVNEKKN